MSKVVFGAGSADKSLLDVIARHLESKHVRHGERPTRIYAQTAEHVGLSFVHREFERGILCCGTGNGDWSFGEQGLWHEGGPHAHRVANTANSVAAGIDRTLASWKFL